MAEDKDLEAKDVDPIDTNTASEANQEEDLIDIDEEFRYDTNRTWLRYNDLSFLVEYSGSKEMQRKRIKFMRSFGNVSAERFPEIVNAFTAKYILHDWQTNGKPYVIVKGKKLEPTFENKLMVLNNYPKLTNFITTGADSEENFREEAEDIKNS